MKEIIGESVIYHDNLIFTQKHLIHYKNYLSPNLRGEEKNIKIKQALNLPIKIEKIF